MEDVRASARTDTGYRLYDDRALSRLNFIAHAKALGCSLEEVAALLDLWNGGRCLPVQDRLRELVTGKIADIDRRSRELAVLDRDLRAAEAYLGSPGPPDAACDDSCACVTDPPQVDAGDGAGAAAVSARIACTLNTPGLQADRVGEWRAVLGHVRRRVLLDDVGLRLELDADVPLEELTRLIVAEHRCCAFFDFRLDLGEGTTSLEVRAPAGAQDVLAVVFGESS